MNSGVHTWSKGAPMLTAFLRFIYSSFLDGGFEEGGTLEEQSAKKSPVQRVRNRDKKSRQKTLRKLDFSGRLLSS